MKLYALYTLSIATILLSCEKKDNNIKADTIDNATTTQSIKESTIEDIEKLVGKHDNDTLYVTNFFATWCGPCMREIPYFKEYKEKMKNQPVKFQFVNLDPKEDWNTEVASFAAKNQLEKDIYLLDGSLTTSDFYTKNFQEWSGDAIPFTIFRKGNKTYEHLGMITQKQLADKLDEMMK